MCLDELLIVNINYDNARKVLETEYRAAEELFRQGQSVVVPDVIINATAALFKSSTQAYREALIGCALARIDNPQINIRLPYVKQADNAYSGRSLDENVVNPLLREQHIPSTKGPYLSSIRRNVSFVPGTLGQRDEIAYTALLDFIGELEKADTASAHSYLRYLMLAFVQLREASNVPLADVKRLSLDQYGILIGGLLEVRSGGLLPVLVTVGAFMTISECFNLNWKIEWQGINVADAARGAGGDITVTRNDDVLFSVEVTEREIDRARVISTFQTKIAPGGIDDYIFFYTVAEPTPEARDIANQYFAQGHDMNFHSVRDWIMTVLSTIGPKCRRLFTTTMLKLLSDSPASVRVAWNEQIQRSIAVLK